MVNFRPPSGVVGYLEDHLRTVKWFITMVSKASKWGYSLSERPFQWLVNRGDPKHLLCNLFKQCLGRLSS